MYRSEGSLYIVDLTQPLERQAPATLGDYDDPEVRFVAWDWSNDGDKLAGTFSGEPMKAGYYSFSERRFVQLTDTRYYPVWLPDGRRILYSFAGMISAIDIRTKKIVDIVRLPEREMGGLGVSKSGDLVYYVVNEEESDIWMLEIVPEAVQ
jgi:hypothetical protein